MIDPMSMKRITYDSVMEKWGVRPNQVGDVLALAGDASDNIPGVPGIGPKTAASLLREHGTLTEVLGNIESLKVPLKRKESLALHKDDALLSRQLVELVRTVPKTSMQGVFVPGLKQEEGDGGDDNDQKDNRDDGDELMLGGWRTKPMDSQRIVSFFHEMGLHDLKRRFLAQVSGVTTKRKPRKRRQEVTEIPKPKDFENVPF
eukprot:CAMPEP_0116823576 /NCGR_PEP_ID=MMETSP0418-20121206/913_1 /TAXON_ID=1158023 /ORGANISM="Astrosyne radiata, Strain 13vi08-1A" /LENGTH=202 /DNA_ID=CAMNT_0004451841 /DNA_START=54 /DNA_END=662 /DNA_ORIENTATION=-